MSVEQPVTASPDDLSPRRTLVISGVNMTEGGILSVLRSVVEAAERTLDDSWDILVLAHRRDLLATRRATVREYPDIKASWWRRMKFELVTSHRISQERPVEAWLALHDITPRVVAQRQYVYCHNPTCFTRPTLRALFFDWIFVAHSLLYGWLYSLNIRRNTEVFVQQAWIREEFLRRFGARSVAVSRPAAPAHHAAVAATGEARSLRRWVYPTFPRHFKNVEVIGQALEILERSSEWAGEVAVTIAGDESRYARWLLRRFGHLKTLKFIGRQGPAQMKALYDGADGLLFPSKLETWGLPITEAQSLGLPLLVADLQYAHETVGDYDAVTFFDPLDAPALADELRALSTGAVAPGRARGGSLTSSHVLTGWDALVAEVCVP